MLLLGAVKPLYTYDGAGNRQTLNETYASDQLSGYVDPNTKQALPYRLMKSQYVYSNTNELLKLVETMYDGNNKEVLKKTTDYLYDNNGNQLRTKVSYVLPYNSGKRQVTDDSLFGDDVTSDISTLIESVSNTFDGFNRLVKAEKIKGGNRSTVTFVYDGDDLRTQKISRSSKDNYAAKVTNYIYDRHHVILETDDAGNTAVRYVHGINYLARIDASNKLSYYLFNGHGDVVQTVSEDGTVENQYDYDIFGNPTLTIEMYAASIRYAGEFYDAETGLYYLRARYYDPYIGRFISEDTYEGKINDPLSLNRYTYANNDPIMYVDPTGHAAKKNNATVLLKDVVKDGYGGSLYWDNKNKAVTIKINNQKVTIKADGKDAAMVNGRVVIKPETLDRYYNNNSVKVNKEVPVRYEISTTATAKEITTKVTTVVPTGQRYSSTPNVITNDYKPNVEIKKVVNEIVKNKEVSQSNFESVVNIIKFECMDNPECQAAPLVPYESKSKSSGSTNVFIDSWNIMENGFNVLKDSVVSDFNKIVETNSTVPGAIDYWGFGSYSAAVGTFNPEKPLSLQHWTDSFQTATTLLAPFRSLLKISGPTVKGAGKVVTYSPANPGPLKQSVAETFSGATYKQVVLTEDATFYRVYGGEAGKVGSYMTRVPQNGGIQSQVDLALKPEWGNTTQYVTKVTVPKGTVIYEGTAAPQTINGGAGQLIGGGDQVYIPEVNANWFGK
ncbi:RHS repeat-associated core domain-containing protein [Cohnella cholangitidis]|uniref:RHS repeat-associated core domain-containing protein n=1 Tax=Cohnella cholangitidis TaxID=2598458 RepID=A0A7G5BZQ6_9BACL|nr:RHS repeat-associated core domain-containing protein [Cohnella cholangitidis]QMV42440.1 RHS repeat-associated core domain-containing protein [Cohnella cholangitidis]